MFSHYFNTLNQFNQFQLHFLKLKYIIQLSFLFQFNIY